MYVCTEPQLQSRSPLPCQVAQEQLGTTATTLTLALLGLPASSPVHLSKHLIKRFGAVCPWISGHFCHKGEKSIQVTLGLPGVFNNDNLFRIMSTLKCVHVSPLYPNSNSNSKHLTNNVLHHKIKPYS